MGHAPGRQLRRQILVASVLVFLFGSALAQELGSGETTPTLPRDEESSYDEPMYDGFPPAPPPDSPDSSPVAQLSSFPFCVCDDYRCGVNPYRLKYASRTPSATEVVLTFRIFKVPGGYTQTTCYKALQFNVGKIELSMAMTCQNMIRGVKLNGKQRTYYFDTEFPLGKLRITALNMNEAAIDGATLELQMSTRGCNTFETIGQGDGTLKYSMMESSNHRCCPICIETMSPPPPAPS
eukprot:CAMPEP_0202861208 /NCGR_PEP_ID=MMETSP1391-20130828/2684_1 /ASSEMBLY_ACC=CAM_ASM_000867 /TAXON_ID=1034604 /ORGANISM="Chlamydomonas leiostraca, Strain SAG 11-49" /LENGTH=236 /DNA_ID=CAMNT_0049540553 /DNA_START=176 /DNA_END=883 /DNA_ORIENTATION=-